MTKVRSHHRLEDLATQDKPWHLFARGKCLETWQQHFVGKDIPHIIAEVGESQALWLKYEYDPTLGYDGGGHKSGNSRKPERPPRCVVEAVRGCK